MANRRISELQEQAGLLLADDDLLTVVRVSEPDPALKNKKLTISGTRSYLNIHYLPKTGGTVSGNVIVEDDLTISGLSAAVSVSLDGRFPTLKTAITLLLAVSIILIQITNL